jgi:hypothetical protein
MARSSECTEQHAQKVIDTAGIVRDAILRQQLAQPFLREVQSKTRTRRITIYFSRRNDALNYRQR